MPFTAAVQAAATPDPIQSTYAPGTGNLPVGTAIGSIVSVTMYGALICCVIALVAAGGMIAVGNLSARPQMAERGKVAVIWSLGGAILVGLAVGLVNGFYGLS